MTDSNAPNLPALFRGAKWQQIDGYVIATVFKTPGLMDYVGKVAGAAFRDEGERDVMIQFPQSTFMQSQHADLSLFVRDEVAKSRQGKAR